MNKKFYIVFTVAFAMLFSLSASAQKFSKMDVSPMDGASFPSSYKVADKLIRVNYGRPQLKDRPVDQLAKHGEVWRTGANEAAEITFYTDMKLGGTTVKAGTYTFYTIPGEKEWTAIINTDLNVWGSYFYDKSKDVARVTVPTTMGDESIEAFSIAFEEGDNGVDMHLGWGKVRVKVPFTK